MKFNDYIKHVSRARKDKDWSRDKRIRDLSSRLEVWQALLDKIQARWSNHKMD